MHDDDDVNNEGDDNNEASSSSRPSVEPPYGIACTAFDIAKGLEDKPVQPRNISFPRDKKNNRSFNSSWYHKHMWLEYSVSKDAAFCYPCRLFSGVQKGDDCFITTGYRNWKNATGMCGRLMKHTQSQRHINASAAWGDFKRNQQSQTSIASTLRQERRQQIQENRNYMKTIIELLLYCAFQEISLRGHREGVNSRNKGNFLELVDIVSNHDSVVKNRLHVGPRNALYTSHSIQDELLKILSNNVVHTICEQVKEAGFYSIIADESRDTAKQEQMLFAVRYVDMTDGCVQEHFLTFIQAQSLDALSLSSYIKQLISTYDFDTNKMVSQGYDGASVMSGHCTGVQTRVREFVPYAAYLKPTINCVY